MAKKTKWGILATGRIAGQFARGLASAEGAELVACGSRSRQSADAFAAEHGIGRACGSYQQLAAQSDVDVIYIATPHTEHCENTLLCLQHGKAVLCEKPFAVNVDQARRMVDAARSAGLFCMEAMWTRFFPAMAKLREILAAGTIGQPRLVQADFGFRTGWDPQSRLLNPDLAGGGLLDVGVYAISLASMVLGPAQRATGLAEIGDTGVDTQAGMVLQHDGGAISVLACGVRTQTPQDAWVLGSEGRIRIHSPFWKPAKLTVYSGDSEQTIQPDCRGNGYNYQAEHVADCLQAARTESPVMPLDETVRVIRTMDQLRSQWGLQYPFE